VAAGLPELTRGDGRVHLAAAALELLGVELAGRERLLEQPVGVVLVLKRDQLGAVVVLAGGRVPPLCHRHLRHFVRRYDHGLTRRSCQPLPR
jgi:hypothetical protein